VDEWSLITIGLVAGLATGLATGLGALPALLVRKVKPALMDTMLGFAAGVMLAATFFSLLAPALEAGGIGSTALGFLLGVLFLDTADRLTPHLHFIAGAEGPGSRLRKIWLFVLAITLHNFPEGLAVGVGFGMGDINRGIALALAIGLQNMPEGLAVALSLTEDYGRKKAVGIATLTGLVEPVGALLGAGTVSFARGLLPYGLAFAAGAMLFVISDEIIPESHRRGFQRQATFGIIGGFLIMMFLDNLFQ